MAEGSTVRLVRCPKCKNLLPELPNFPVYQCGGCGAVLRGKKSTPVSDGLLEKSEDESSRKGFEKQEVSVESASEFERENDDFDLNNKVKDRFFNEKSATLESSSSSRTETMEVLIGSDQTRRRRPDQSKIGVYDDNYGRASRVPNDNWVRGNDRGLNMNVPKYGSLGVSNESQEIRQPFGSVRSRSVIESNGSVDFHRNGSVVEKGRFGIPPYPYEGPSNYHLGSFNSFGEHITNHDGLDGLNRVEHLENDRAELLKKLDELKAQLEKPKEKLDRYSGHNTLKPEVSNGLYNVNVKPPGRDCSRYHGTVPYARNHALEMQDFYPPPRYAPNEILRYEDPYHPQIIRRFPHQPPFHYMPPSYHDRLPHETFFHQPSCSCLQCYKKNVKIPQNVPPPVFRSRDPSYPVLDCVNPVTYGPPPNYNNSRSFVARQLRSLERPLMRRSSDIDSDYSGFGQRRPRRVIVTRGGERVFHPIAGGAPFITCCNCFELLKIPRKLMVVGKNQRKMKCGGCSAVISFQLEDKSFVVSVSAPIKEVGNGSGGTSNKSLHSSSRDYDNSGYDFQLTDTEPNLLSSDQRSSLSEADKRLEPHFSSSSFSEDELSPDSVIVRRDVSDHTDLPSKDISSLPLPDSPPRENTSSCSNVVSPYGKGNQSKRTDQQNVIVDESISQQKSLKDASTATEMNVSLNEYLSSGNSVEVSKEEDQHRNNKGSDSFLAGLIKRRFRDFSRSSSSTEKGRSNVSVNGQLIPHRVVKKAEKLAGPIQPGEYWYDYVAGFWGVMYQPCLGVIPPFIEEFNYPMPENCAAGNTGVFVNGRELNQRDLDLLAGRGLPNTRDKSYIIEISGKVVDEDTHEELDSLGKLAPTVEKVKHGFGMKVPRAIAQ